MVTIKEINAKEVINAQAKRTGTSARTYVPKKYRGRNLMIIVPEPPTCFLEISLADLETLESKINLLKFPRQYSHIKKQDLKHYIINIKRNPDSFPEDHILKIYEGFHHTTDSKCKEVLRKIKLNYGL